MFSRASKRTTWQGLLVCLLAVTILGAGRSDSATRFGRIGGNLMCVCGCSQMLLQCNHVGCPDSGPMMQELHEQLAGPNGQGADALILNWFVAKYGATVLAAPIRGGFDIVAWIIPLAMFVLATLGTALLVRAWSGRRQALAGSGLSIDAPLHGPMEEAVRDRIRRETEW